MNGVGNNKAARRRGYTLIEVLIVVVILGILLSVAVPSFESYLRRSNREDAIALLSNTVMRLERCFTLEGSYDGSCTLKTTSDSGHYQLVAERASDGYTLSAVPVAGGRQAGDSDCMTLQMDSTGYKAASGSLGARCW